MTATIIQFPIARSVDAQPQPDPWEIFCAAMLKHQQERRRGTRSNENGKQASQHTLSASDSAPVPESAGTAA